MPSSKKNEIALKTTSDFRGVAKVVSSPMRDLALSRQLTQRALDEGNVASACLFAIASAKLLGPCSTHAIEHHELLLKPAAMRVAEAMIVALAKWLEEQKVESWHEMTSVIATRLSKQMREQEKQQ